VIRGETGAVLTEDTTGETIIAGFAPVPGTGWGLVTQERWDVVMGPIRRYGTLLLGILIGGSVISGALVFFSISRVLRPIRDLTRGAERIAGGDFDHTVVVKTGDEIEALARQFNAMSAALKDAFARLEHLNAVLRAIRSVNQLITKERDRDRLLQGACDNLIETPGYYNAWVALLDESGGFVTSAEAGLGEEFLPLVERLERGELTPCGRRALKQPGVVAVKDPLSACADCPLSAKYSGWGAMTVRLEHEGKVYGLSCVSIPRDLVASEEEQALFREVAGDIAFALHNMELEKGRKQTEEALRVSEERFALAVQGSDAGLWDWDIQNDSLYWSPRFKELLGYADDELEVDFDTFESHLHPDDREQTGTAIEAYLKDRELYEVEQRLRTKSGQYRWFLARGQALWDEAGNPVRMVGSTTDITERQQAEEELKEYSERLEEMVEERTTELDKRVAEVEQLNQGMSNLMEVMQAANRNLEATAAKLQEVNQELNDFAYVVSHDLKAPLRAVTQLTGWIATDYADALDEEGQEMMNLLIGRTKRMHNLIQGILEYSRIGRVKEREKEVDLNWLVQDTIEMLAPPEHVQMTIKSELPTVVGEQIRLEQVFQNLLGNAIRFMDKSAGCVIIDCADEGSHWLFSVADNGPGIEEKYHDKVFQMFQTLAPRDEFESTGVGLALVKKIVETSGGSIWLESEVGKGSTFYFTLPKEGGENEEH